MIAASGASVDDNLVFNESFFSFYVGNQWLKEASEEEDDEDDE